MSMQIQKEIYKKPSGTVRGYATCFLVIGKKEYRLAHCYFLVDAPTEVTLNIPKCKLAPQDVAAISSALAAFNAEISDV